MIEFMLEDRRMRLIEDVFYIRAFSYLGIETKKEKWSKVSFCDHHGYLRCNLTLNKVQHKLYQHRLVWYAHHQDWDIWDSSTNNFIDHKNKDKKDKLQIREITRVYTLCLSRYYEAIIDFIEARS